jgi:hypothetical protein
MDYRENGGSFRAVDRGAQVRRAIQLYCVLYGCLGSVLAFAWFLSALFGRFVGEASRLTVVLSGFLLHALAACLTFQRYSRRWEPLVTLTSNRIRFAKVLFATGSLNFVGCFVIFGLAAQMKNQDLLGYTVYLVVSSLVLQNTIYIAIHWMVRPENIFPKWFIEMVTNPVGFFLYR